MLAVVDSDGSVIVESVLGDVTTCSDLEGCVLVPGLLIPGTGVLGNIKILHWAVALVTARESGASVGGSSDGSSSGTDLEHCFCFDFENFKSNLLI